MASDAMTVCNCHGIVYLDCPNRPRPANAEPQRCPKCGWIIAQGESGCLRLGCGGAQPPEPQAAPQQGSARELAKELGHQCIGYSAPGNPDYAEGWPNKALFEDAVQLIAHHAQQLREELDGALDVVKFCQDRMAVERTARLEAERRAREWEEDWSVKRRQLIEAEQREAHAKKSELSRLQAELRDMEGLARELAREFSITHRAGVAHQEALIHSCCRLLRDHRVTALLEREDTADAKKFGGAVRPASAPPAEPAKEPRE